MKELLFSVTAADCDWSYTRGTGKGGQKRNKTSSAVHCTHRASGAHGYSEASRSQVQNKRDAFRKMVDTIAFRNWQRIEVARHLGIFDDIAKTVDYEMEHNVCVEVQSDGHWVKEEV